LHQLQDIPFFADFFSLELRDGRPVLIINYGDKTGFLETKDRSSRVNDGNWHYLTVRWGPGKAIIFVDNRPILEGLLPEARDHKMLNLNEPLQLGGVVHDMSHLVPVYGWELGYSPAMADVSFKGCMANFTVNGQLVDFADAYLKDPEVTPECKAGPDVGKLATWKAKPEFYVAVVGSLAGLLREYCHRNIRRLIAQTIHRSWKEGFESETY
jgi:hypothetical protein